MRNKGFSLVELLVGISIMAVVGLMITSLLGSSTRLYRSTISSSNIQTESQTVGRRIGNAVMEASSIYLYEGEPGTYLFTGERKAEAGKVTYSGPIFWFNRETGCLYQNSSFRVEEEADAGETAGLSANAVMGELEGGSNQGREYLISDKVKSLDFMVYPELTEEERIGDGDYYYKTDGTITVNYKIRFQYQDSKSHTVKSGATPRNRVEVLWWNSSTAMRN